MIYGENVDDPVTDVYSRRLASIATTTSLQPARNIVVQPFLTAIDDARSVEHLGCTKVMSWAKGLASGWTPQRSTVSSWTLCLQCGDGGG